MKNLGIVGTISVLALAFSVSVTPVFAQQVVTDGMTATNVTVNGNTTNVSTSTVSGGNAFNSLAKLNVDSGKVVNLVLPNGVSNLINIVKGQQSVINGALNGIQNGQIGGNVFLVNPFGFVVGSTGSINVGQLTAITPTQDFANNFFSAVGVVNPSSLNALLSGTAPINPGATITNSGVINVISSANITAPNVVNNGKILANASFKTVSDYSNVNVADIVNLNAADKLGITGGSVVINADKITNNGYIYATGGDVNITKLSPGYIKIQTAKSSSDPSLQLTPTELNKIKASNLALSADNVNFYKTISLTTINSLQAYANNKVTVGDYASLSTKGNLILTGTNGVVIGDKAIVKSTANGITMNAFNGSVIMGCSSQVSAYNDINANASSNVTVGSSAKLTTSGALSIYAGNTATIGSSSQMIAKKDIDIYAENDVNINKYAKLTSTTESISIYAGDAATVNAGSVLTAKKDIDLTAINSLKIYGTTMTAGNNINLISNALDLRSCAKLKAGGKINKLTP